MADMYSQSYFSELEKAERVEYPRNARIINEILPFVQKGKLLDIGVGTGLFMEIAEKKGFEVYGLDVSSYAIDEVAKRLNLKKRKRLVVSELRKDTFPKNYFDVVNLRHSIEHVKDPQQLLKNVFSILKPSGVVAIATPNSFGPHAKAFGDLWPHWSQPYHIQFFSKSSLKKIAIHAGFKILKYKTEELTNYDLLRIGLRRIGLPINYNRATKMTYVINDFLAKVGLGEGLLMIAQKPL